MNKKVIIKKAGKKGKGVFALKNFKKGEIILHNDTTKLKRYTLKEISKNPKLKRASNHCDYVGYGKYVIDLSPTSYINHSCNPNCYAEFKRLCKGDVIALRPIKKGEELTIDCTLGAIDQIRGAYPKKDVYYWRMKCYCGSKNCRKIIHGDFFRLPEKIQIEKLPYLPTWLKRKYRKRIKLLRKFNKQIKLN